ncbi:hypothetical protein [Qipengyuania soli]|uniref:Lipoprotein n=1 Tax=Qipengyuania soli TaxID=2782568 RepID=A0A7S8IVI2_9SPHN|nr:hypothetical protein [Qipengyuania soli]QPC99917.1 hypothetical protein IRL76_05115 [Qipengyuania soli]
MKRHALALPLLIVLAACGKSDPEPLPTPTATVAAPRNLVAADLNLATLGAKVVGPQGSQVETVLSAGNAEIGTMVSYVACPAEVTECVPGKMPEGTLYTYVHQVTLDDAEKDEIKPTSGPEVVEAAPTLFRTTAKAHGFTGAIGYAKAEAEAALGAPEAITTTLDNGGLIWRVTEGGGWKPGSTITFWWQSTLPPAGPADNYLLEVDGNHSAARGPFPAEDKPVEGKKPR